MWLRRSMALLTLSLAATGGVPADTPILGLAYQPYVGHWSARTDNPYAPGDVHVPAFNSYVGGIDVENPDRSLWAATQTLRLTFDEAGRLQDVSATGSLDFLPEALRGQDAVAWSHTKTRFFEDRTPQTVSGVDHAASVYRQLDALRRAAGGAPLTLATYGTGFQAGYWRQVDGQDYVALPFWTDRRLLELRPGETMPYQRCETTDVVFLFPPTAVHVRPAPERLQVETAGTPGQDLRVVAIHQTLFEPTSPTDPEARLNPGFFAGDANAQIALAAAEINAQAGRRLLTLKLGVDNIQVAGTLVNDRMRFAILSALAQAQVANARFPGTVTHLILSNEYAQPWSGPDGQPSPTEQITAMLKYARAQMAPNAAFAGLDLRLGARGHRFRLADPNADDPALARFGREVAALLAESDYVMENLYPSPEAVEAAAQSGQWSVYFDPDKGELSRKWCQLERTIRTLAGERPIEIMIGEIGHPTDGIAFNLPGYVEDGAPIRPDTAFAAIADRLDTSGARLDAGGLAIARRYFSPALASAFVREAVAWSRTTGVQIHLFEAFDEPWKSSPNLPADELATRRTLLGRSGPYGAEANYGLFGYSGVSGLRPPSQHPTGIAPGSRLAPQLPDGVRWNGAFEGQFFPKRPDLDFAALAHSFTTTTP
ncbi:hypothetical protein [Allochromatium vinosum]|uniref:Glycoside hydrolase family 5 domain-containing protein n=1 Tax=Allochromatium vinosum (strain ATCC 17899 / DSM 180 / NBRC 103801 / NCIMB 10441 / D) TaxID=572477 RepID=D3RQB7_ALLVD|nr:hypothetical protein [Allochromatium vinosum]ADC61722.1 hypothetical protein Alvin_0775 [Allochromatium vinosum DSM 180]